MAIPHRRSRAPPGRPPRSGGSCRARQPRPCGVGRRGAGRRSGRRGSVEGSGSRSGLHRVDLCLRRRPRPPASIAHLARPVARQTFGLFGCSKAKVAAHGSARRASPVGLRQVDEGRLGRRPVDCERRVALGRVSGEGVRVGAATARPGKIARLPPPIREDVSNDFRVAVSRRPQ